MKTIGICGAGLIGASWAVGFANAGFKCLVYDSYDESFEKFENMSNQLLQDIKILEPDLDVKKIKSNIILRCSLEDICKNSILIQESIIEDLDTKKKVFSVKYNFSVIVLIFINFKNIRSIRT